MRPLLFLVFAISVRAQQTGDARSLLEQVAAAARSMDTLRAEGTIASEVQGAAQGETTFAMEFRKPHYLRMERNGAVNSLTVCDGSTAWAYAVKTRLYMQVPVDANCRPGIAAWEHVMDGLQSASFLGGAEVIIDGQPRACQLVRAEYPQANGQVTRKMCIDAERKLILQDQVENQSGARRFAMTTSLRHIEVNPGLAADLFLFHPPEGSQPARTPPSMEALQRAGASQMPIVVQKGEPEYTKDALAKRISGTVLISLTVQTDGTPSNIRVVRSLDPGLDAKAVEAVGKWRFRPGLKQGVPVPVQATVEVNFRLLDNPPPPPPQ